MKSKLPEKFTGCREVELIRCECNNHLSDNYRIQLLKLKCKFCKLSRQIEKVYIKALLI